jgi:uncharacterized protein (TIGR02453 family)
VGASEALDKVSFPGKLEAEVAMADYATLVPDALGFFEALGANMNRDWFAAHKADYEARVKHPAEALLAEVAAGLEARRGLTLTPKLYRIYRDVRFSRDKTPYNRHLHLQWSDKGAGLCFLFGASADYVCAGVGAMTIGPEKLPRWRERVAGAQGAALAAELAQLLAKDHRVDAPALKRVPAPWPQDHPRADLLRRKGLIAWHDLAPAQQADLPGALYAAFERMEGFRQALAAALG